MASAAIDDRDADGLVGTGLDAGGRLAVLQAVAAHVALAHDAALLVVLGRVVGAHQDAVLAADALVIEVLDDAGDRILLVGLDRAAGQAGGLQAVVARGGDGLLRGGLRGSAVQQADGAPDLAVVQAVQVVAAGDAGLAAGAQIQVDLERVLLAGARCLAGNEISVGIGLSRRQPGPGARPRRQRL